MSRIGDDAPRGVEGRLGGLPPSAAPISGSSSVSGSVAGSTPAGVTMGRASGVEPEPTFDLHAPRVAGVSPAPLHVPVPSIDLGAAETSKAGTEPSPGAAKGGALETLKGIVAEGASLRDPSYDWLRAFRGAGTAERIAFEGVFEEGDAQVRYRPTASDEQAEKVLEHYLRRDENGCFRAGAAATMFGKLHPLLRVVGHHWDDLSRVARHALGLSTGPTYASRLDAGDHQHTETDAASGLHIHHGKPLKEVGLVLAVALAIAHLAEGPGKKLPWVVRTSLKALGTYPFFSHVIRGELKEALALSRHGELDEAMHQLLISALVLFGVVSNKGADALAAGTVMSSILSAIGHVETDAVEQSKKSLRSTLASVPVQVRLADGTEFNARELMAEDKGSGHPGHALQLGKGDIVPVDVTIESIGEDRQNVLVDTSRSRGQLEQRATVGDRLAQGSVILDDVKVIARVKAVFDESSVAERVLAAANDGQSADREPGLSQKIGSYWVWGTLAGTVLVALYETLKPLAKGKELSLRKILTRTTSFATLAAPCNILVSPMVQSATTRRLLSKEINIKPIHGDAIDRLHQATAYCFDFTGTCSVGAELKGMTFVDARGVEVTDAVLLETLLAESVAVGMAADSQHLKQKGMRTGLFKRMSADEVRRLAGRATATEEAGRGVQGVLDGKEVRVGSRRHVLHDPPLTELQANVLGTGRNDSKHTFAYARVGEYVGVLRFEDSLRPEAKKVIQRLGTDRVYILTGDENADYVLERTDQLGIPRDHVKTRLFPNDKVSFIQSLQAKGEKVAMFADGTNDVPALKQADVRYALGDNVHAEAQADADFLLPDLASIEPLERMSKRVHWITQATLAFSICYTALTSLAQATGFKRLPVIGAAIAHEGVSGLIALAHDQLSRMVTKKFVQERDYLFALGDAS